MKTINNKFDDLCQYAIDAYDETIEGVSYESTLVDILEFIESNESEKPFFVERFKEIMESSDMPLEVVSFCMRKFRWPEIKEYASKCIRESSDPRSHALITITEAYEDDWPDEDLYEYFLK
jgi:hypothetical protein